MNTSLIITKMGKLQESVEKKSKDLITTDLKTLIKKGVNNKPLNASQHKILADFLINIVPELSKNEVLNKLLREISKRKEDDE